MTVYEIKNMAQLLDMVAASCPDPQDKGPIVVQGTLWDGRIVRGSYYHGEKYQSPDAETRNDFFHDTDPLKPFVDRMLKTSESFVIVTGSCDMVCCLEWTITQP